MMGLMHGAERILAQGVPKGCWWACTMGWAGMRGWAGGGLFARHRRGVTKAGGAGCKRVVSGTRYRLKRGRLKESIEGVFIHFLESLRMSSVSGAVETPTLEYD